LPWGVGRLARDHGLRSALWLGSGAAGMIFLLQLAILRADRVTKA